MSTFRIYQKRDFSNFINDTVGFFKTFSKNYFLNYSIINGGLVILVSLMYFFLLKDSLANVGMKHGATALQSNSPLFVFSGLLFFIVVVVFGVLSLAYPMAYLKSIERDADAKITASGLFSAIKSMFGRIALFGFISMFVMMPLFVVVVVAGVALSFVLIGIPLLVVAVPLMSTWSMQAIFVYVHEDAGYFEALGKSWKSIIRNFWPVVGSSIVILVILMVVYAIFSIIPLFATVGTIVSTGQTGMSPVWVLFNLVSAVTTYYLYNVVYIHQGLVYYSSLNAEENIEAYSEIDNIGVHEG